ncbi:hypothetical protein PWT90_11262 [Aphanocladium album]|nr:hypothetical protein PWT90_11262 [Aphanocladium album]
MQKVFSAASASCPHRDSPSESTPQPLPISDSRQFTDPGILGRHQPVLFINGWPPKNSNATDGPALRRLTAARSEPPPAYSFPPHRQTPSLALQLSDTIRNAHPAVSVRNA